MVVGQSFDDGDGAVQLFGKKHTRHLVGHRPDFITQKTADVVLF